MAHRMTISDRDVRTMLRMVDCPDDAPGGPDQPIPWSVLAGLRDLISCESINFFELDSDRQVVQYNQTLPDDELGEPQAASLLAAFWAHYPSCRPCSYPDDSGDLTSVTTFSDFYSQRELRATGMYADYFSEFSAEREIMLCLPSPRYRTLRLMLVRGRGPDFSDRDRALLRLLRPHLYARFKASTRRPPVELTARQRELLGLVAAGYTNGQIARRMSVADSTVRKHLENIFERLQVTSRTAAVARVLGTGVSD
jgi:DNA-binding CsgD family transcriptional regulator